MREISCGAVQAAVSRLCIQASRTLPPDAATALSLAKARETAALPLAIFEQFAANQAAAIGQGLPLCQDTGMAVVFARLGQEVRISNGLLNEAIQAGVAEGYERGYLRQSMVSPFVRQNTGDNTPAIIHLELVAGDQLELILLPKGGGAENMSALAMLKPSQGLAGIKDFLLHTVEQAGANACPPLVVGIGIGGNFEQAPLLAKQALCRAIGSVNPEPELAALEEAWLAAVNGLGVGVQGFGGPNTALAVFIKAMPCHFATLPVAVNLNCHLARQARAVL